MAKGTGVFMPAYAAARADASQKESRSSDDTNKSSPAASKRNSSSTSRGRRSRSAGCSANATARPGCGLQVSSTVNDIIASSGPCQPQLLFPATLSQQRFPSPSPSTSSASDLDILSAASDASFTSTCSSLLATSPFAPYAADMPTCAYDTAFSHLTQQDMRWGGASLQPQALLAQGPCQPLLGADLTDLVLLQQELEVDAAINNLVNLKQQLAAIKQQPSAVTPYVQQQGFARPSTPLSVSAATAAMVPAASSTSSMQGDVSLQAVLDAAVAEFQMQQVALQEQQHQERLQLELLQLLSLA